MGPLGREKGIPSVKTLQNTIASIQIRRLPNRSCGLHGIHLKKYSPFALMGEILMLPWIREAWDAIHFY